MRYRGAIEYDKMVLNILNFYNEVEALCEDEPIISEIGQTLGSYIERCDLLINQFENFESAAMVKIKKEKNNFISFKNKIGEKY